MDIKSKEKRKKILGYHKRIHRLDKFYGTTTLGARGQVVIPVEARKDLDLRPGDQLLVMGKFGKALGIIKAKEMEGFVKMIMNKVSDSPVESEVKKHMDHFFGNFKKKGN